MSREYKPEVELPAEASTLMDTKLGQDVEVILNYIVVEKTKSYTVLRITGAMKTSNDRRVY